MDQIVNPVSGVFSFIGSDGRSLRDMAIELNEGHAMYIVKRNGDSGQLSELENTLEKIKSEGPDRQSMMALESMTDFGPLDEKYPASTYTLKPSRTNSAVAVEEVSSRILEVGKTMIKRLVELIRSAIKLVTERFPMFKSRREKMAAELKERESERTEAEYMTPEEISADPNLSAELAALKESFNAFAARLSDSGDRFPIEYARLVQSLDGFVRETTKEVEVLSNLVDAVSNSKTVTEEDLRKVKPQDDYEIPTINKFASYLGNPADNNQDAVRTMNDWLVVSRDEPAKLDPLDLNDIQRRTRQLEKVLDPNSGPFIFPESLLNEMKSLTNSLSTLSDKADSVLLQPKRSNAAKESQSDLRGLLSSITGAERLYRNVAQVINFGEGTYTHAFKHLRVLDDYLRKITKK